MDLGITGKTAVVTGASGRLGRAIALALGREGARIAVGYGEHRDAAERVVAELADVGAEGVPVRIRLDEGDAADEVMAEACRVLGPVSILVNNAVAWPEPPGPDQRFEDVPLSVMVGSVASNLVGTYAISQAAVAQMRPPAWGRIVHVSTGLVEDGFAGSAAYTTPKAGLHGLTRTMSRELACHGILTNLVMAGYLTGGDEPPALLAQVRESAATGRTTEPSEVATLVAYLASTANGHITGERIRADGHFLAGT